MAKQNLRMRILKMLPRRSASYAAIPLQAQNIPVLELLPEAAMAT
jgi:hypothetical protein